MEIKHPILDLILSWVLCVELAVGWIMTFIIMKKWRKIAIGYSNFFDTLLKAFKVSVPMTPEAKAENDKETKAGL